MVTPVTENTYLRCDIAISTRSGHFQHHHHSFSTRLFRATLALIRVTTLSYIGVIFVGWHFDVTFLSYTLFVLMVYVLLYIISLHCVVCWHIVLILIEYWYSIMNRLWTGWTGVWILVGARFFSSSKHSDQLWDDPTSYSMCIGFLPGKRQPGCEVYHSLPSTAEDTNDWSYTSTYPVCLYVWILVEIF